MGGRKGQVRGKENPNPLIFIIVFVIVFVIIFASIYLIWGLFEDDGKRSKHNIDLRVMYNYEWIGGISLPDFSSKSISGVGDKAFNYIGYTGDIFVISAQKYDDTESLLELMIFDNNDLVKHEYTNTAYGFVTVTYTVP